MEQKRHVGVTVIAVVNFVFGTLGLLSLGLVFVSTGLHADLIRNWMDGIPSFRTYFFVVEIGMTVISGAMLIISGVGLIKMAAWGRMTAIGYGLLGILICIVSFIYGTTVLVSKIDSAIDEVAPHAREFQAYPPQHRNMVADIFKLALKCAYIGGPFLGAIYPIIVLWVMLLPSTRQVFRDRSASRQPSVSDEDDAEFKRDEPPYGDGYY